MKPIQMKKILTRNESSAPARRAQYRMPEGVPYFWYSLAVAFVFITICSRLSFLYPFNVWTDSNTFMTVGRSMLAGKVLYRDIYEQKGILLYVIHALGWLLSNRMFFGVYILEVISFGTTLFYFHKISALFLRPVYSWFLLPVAAAVITSANAFCAGDNAEEFGFLFLTISLYYLLRFLKSNDDRDMSYRVFLANGVMAGCVFWIKYTLLGFFIGWALTVFLLYLIVKKDYKKAFLGGFTYLGGMLLSSLPWIAYFAFNHALGDFFRAYLYNNIMLYSDVADRSITLAGRLVSIEESFFYKYRDNRLFLGLQVIGVLGFCRGGWLKNTWSRLSLALCYLLLFILIYWGGQIHMYAPLISAPFVILGLLVIAAWLRRQIPILGGLKRGLLPACVCLILLTGAFAYLKSPNTFLMRYDYEDLAQYQVAREVEKTPDATLLNYGFLDGGFYLATNTIPTCKYFCGLNLSPNFTELQETQDLFVREKRVDYVICLNEVPEIVSESYEVVLDIGPKECNNNDHYILLKKK